MSEQLTIPNYVIRIGLVAILLMILSMAWNRIKGTFIKDWDHELQLPRLRKRPILMTIMKMYSNVQSSPPGQLAEDVRNELIVNLGLAYDKPTSYFVRLRDNPQKLREYLKDDELVEFFYRPQIWADQHQHEVSSLFGLLKSRSSSDEFITELQRIIDKFEKVIRSVRIDENEGSLYTPIASDKLSQT